MSSARHAAAAHGAQAAAPAGGGHAAALRERLRLYLVTDEASLRGRTLADVVLAAIDGGVTCVQIREKRLDARDFYAKARALMELLAPRAIPLVVNDRVDIALACGAHGVHLGQSDLPVHRARELLPAHVFIGWSVESDDDVERARDLPVDYLGVSPVFATPTKTDAAAPWGLEGLRRVRARTALPLVAIGGVNAGNAADLLDAGADSLAVVSAILSAPHPGEAARALRRICDPTF